MKRNNRKWSALLMALLCFFLASCTAKAPTGSTKPSQQTVEGETGFPWEKPGAKQPAEYTWEEFQALTSQQQVAFRQTMGADAFNQWLDQAWGKAMEMPWQESGAKQPADYTWEEFEALTGDQQIAFQNAMGEEAFKEWMDKALGLTVSIPWEEPGAKQPADYTWEEFEALNGNQQIAFQNALGEEAFEKWMEKAQGLTVNNPWEKPGAKKPADYTWEEFEALTADQQIAFQNALGEEAFEKWMEKAQGLTADNPWDKPGAKQPEDYTWEEFEALTADQQIAFQNELGPDAFEAWMNKAQSTTAAYPWEKPGAKQPEDYTMEEFEALTGEQQMAFQNYLGPDAFEAWLNRVLGEG